MHPLRSIVGVQNRKKAIEDKEHMEDEMAAAKLLMEQRERAAEEERRVRNPSTRIETPGRREPLTPRPRARKLGSV